MPLHRTIAAIALALGSFLAMAASPPKWNALVTLTPQASHVLGNPQAKLKVTEYVSYTCSHCANFEMTANAPLKLGYISSGNVSVEVKHLLRDPVDATVAQLTNCGPKEMFFANHSTFMRTQSQWIGLLGTASEGQRQRWTTGDFAARRRAIAHDFHFYEIMEQRGYSRPVVDHCLADETLAKHIAAHTAEAEQLGIDSTPSFAINGLLLAGTHTWETLEAQLRARL